MMTETGKCNTKADAATRVEIRVQAPGAEIEDLVEVLVGRLEGMELVLVERDAVTLCEDVGCAGLLFEAGEWWKT